MAVTATIRRASARFVDRVPGRVTHHAFAFGRHYDSEHVGFGPLVCHDDHLLGSGQGFETHRHADLEIVTWVVAGAVTHSDGVSGEPTVVVPGTVGLLSAGSGVEHAEHATADGPARFVQAWLTPDETGTPPSYAAVPVDLEPDRLVLVASGSDDAAPVRLATSGATLSVARLGHGVTLALPEAPRLHVFVASGALTRSSLAEPLSAGDALLVTDAVGLEVTAAVPTELMVWVFG